MSGVHFLQTCFVALDVFNDAIGCFCHLEKPAIIDTKIFIIGKIWIIDVFFVSLKIEGR